MSGCASVSSVDASQLSHASHPPLCGPRRRFVGTDGAVVSVVVGVVTVNTLLSATLPVASRTVTTKVCVLPGLRSCTRFELPKALWSRATPSTWSVYQTWLLVSSVDVVHARRDARRIGGGRAERRRRA